MNKILIDVGSSTIKAYKYITQKLEPLIQKTIPFKEGFDPEGGIARVAKKELFELIESVKEGNKEDLVKIYATGIFRKLADETRVSFIDEFFSRTDLFFNIITQDLENFYLEMALVGKCTLNEPVLLINIGGGSTELVVMYGKEVIERKNIDLGVGTINTRFPEINESIARVKLEKAVDFAKNILPPLSNNSKVAIYSGGELEYMKLVDYPLKKNDLFEDEDHPSLVFTKSFIDKNQEVFRKKTLQELESLMPNNPKWMHGARGCSAIAQAICEKYGIETIIPSNSNIINGVVRQESR